MKDKPLGEIEYRAFLNMWLCRFVFCGKANEPTLSSAQKDCQERLDNFRQTTLNVRGVIAKYLNI
jgi:hypothetical protein